MDRFIYIIKRKLYGDLKILILYSRVKNNVTYHSKIKFISSLRRVISSIHLTRYLSLRKTEILFDMTFAEENFRFYFFGFQDENFEQIFTKIKRCVSLCFHLFLGVLSPCHGQHWHSFLE